MMFSKRRTALASGAAVASIALSGARAQSAEDESRLLIAVTAPKIVDVGGGSDGEGFATISFKTGPNLVSYDYTVSCYERDLSVPTTSCNAIADEDYPTAGNSVSGETGKAYDKITATVTGLDGDAAYDCFIYTSGPNGYEKCKYVGSTDIDCFAAEPLAFEEDASGPIIDGGEAAFELTAIVSGSGNPPIPVGEPDTVGFVCVSGSPDDVSCPVDPQALDIEYPQVGVTDIIVNVDPDYNEEFTCFSLIENSCDATADPICSDGLGLVSAPTLAGKDPENDFMFSMPSIPDGTIEMTCGRDVTLDAGALPVVNFWTCVPVGSAGLVDWFQVDCPTFTDTDTPAYTVETRAITGFVLDVTLECALWQGQGDGCSPYSLESCNWYLDGTDSTAPSDWFNSVVWS